MSKYMIVYAVNMSKYMIVYKDNEGACHAKFCDTWIDADNLRMNCCGIGYYVEVYERYSGLSGNEYRLLMI